MLALLTFGKWALNGLLSAITYAVEHWRVFLPILMICIAVWYVRDLQHERDAAISALNTYVTEAKAAKVKRTAENLDKERSIKSVLAVVDVTHESKIGEIRKEYDAKNKSAINLNDANWRKRLRDQVAAIAPRVSGLPQAPGESSQVRGDGDAATIGTLDTACAITTADYNALWESWDRACKIYGCK